MRRLKREWREVKWSKVKLSEVQWCEMMWSNVKWCEEKCSEVKWSNVKLSEVHWCEMMWSNVKWCEEKCSEVKWLCGVSFISIYILSCVSVTVQYVTPLFAYVSLNCLFCVLRLLLRFNPSQFFFMFSIFVLLFYILFSVDRAALYNLVNRTNLVHKFS